MYQKVVIFLTLICLTFAKDIRLPKDSGLCPNSVKKFQQLLNQQNAQCQLNLKKLSSREMNFYWSNKKTFIQPNCTVFRAGSDFDIKN